MISDPYTHLEDRQLHDHATSAALSVPWLSKRSFRILTGSAGHWFREGYGLSSASDPVFYNLTKAVNGGDLRTTMAPQKSRPHSAGGPAAKLALALTSRSERGDSEQACDLLLSPGLMVRWGLEPGRVARFMEAAHHDQVVFGSPVQDIAETNELAAETVELGEVLLRLTQFQIRLLSRSPEVAYSVARGLHQRLPGASKSRVIFGLAIGGFEQAATQNSKYTPNATEQVGALNWLQDHGFRSFCLLGTVASSTSGNMRGLLRSLRADRCEDIWTSNE